MLRNLERSIELLQKTRHAIWEAKFPGIRDFHFTEPNYALRPIEYKSNGNTCIEFPPGVSWKIGDKTYKYRLLPKFRTDERALPWIFSIFSSRSSTTAVTLEYESEMPLIELLVQASLRNATDEEMNRIADDYHAEKVGY